MAFRAASPSDGQRQPERRHHVARDDDWTTCRMASTAGRGERFADLLQRRISRRGVLKAGAVAGTLLVTGPALRAHAALAGEAGREATRGSIRFSPLAPRPTTSDSIAVAAGHQASVLLRWGDPIFRDAPDFDPDNLTAEAQAQQFGYNCDFLGWCPLPIWADDSEQGLLWVNHEYTNPELMFAGYDADNPTWEQVEVELTAHGASVVAIHRHPEGRLIPAVDSPYNRRITALTPMRISGPAAGHPWMRTSSDVEGTLVYGMLNNCAGGRTPWGTILTCEENFHQYFANLDLLPEDDPRYAVHERYGIGGGESDRKWERFHARFNVPAEPNEAFRFGWVVEVDPYDPTSVPVKRTALGRLRHEGATFGYSPSGRVAFYSGDDERFEYIYKFVSNAAWDRARRADNQHLLDEGVLHAARFNDDGSGDWLPLVYGDDPLTAENGFTSQGDVLIMTRQAADLLGATKMDRPEDIQQNPVNHKVYAALTNNTRRGVEDNPGVDAANPRANNKWGHIIEITEDDDDAAATSFRWEIFILCGDPADESTYFAGFPKEYVSPIATPDNLNFDLDGNLWIATDGQPSALGHGDGIFVVPTSGAQRGNLQQFLSAVNGSEVASEEFTSDNRTFFVSIQHPGEGGTVEEPVCLWPDGGPLPRPSVVQVWNTDGGRVGGGDLLPPWQR